MKTPKKKSAKNTKSKQPSKWLARVTIIANWLLIIAMLLIVALALIAS